MRHLSLFSGIGGMDLGFEQAGMVTVGQVEIDPFCRQVLEQHWPNMWRWNDITTLDPMEVPEHDIISAGFPCQPTSLSGRRRHDDDERWLWPEVRRLVGVLRPEWLVLENPPGLLSLGFGGIANDLAACGYGFAWSVLSACGFGAPHARERVFIVAHPGSVPSGLAAYLHRGPEWGFPDISPGAVVSGEHGEDGSEGRLAGGRMDSWAQVVGRPAPEPFLHGMANGVPRRLDRERALGNAVVPQVAEWIGRRLAAYG